MPRVLQGVLFFTPVWLLRSGRRNRSLRSNDVVFYAARRPALNLKHPVESRHKQYIRTKITTQFDISYGFKFSRR